MKRKEFITTCSIGCIGFSWIGILLQGCSGSKVVISSIEGEYLIVPLSEFEILKNEEKSYHPYIIAQNSSLQYPICVYRLGENDYTALLMRCTHQGTELQVFGNKLQCPAHGSEFEKTGKVTSGPASMDLRTFTTIIENNKLKITLS